MPFLIRQHKAMCKLQTKQSNMQTFCLFQSSFRTSMVNFFSDFLHTKIVAVIQSDHLDLHQHYSSHGHITRTHIPTLQWSYNVRTRTPHCISLTV